MQNWIALCLVAGWRHGGLAATAWWLALVTSAWLWQDLVALASSG